MSRNNWVARLSLLSLLLTCLCPSALWADSLEISEIMLGRQLRDSQPLDREIPFGADDQELYLWIAYGSSTAEQQLTVNWLHLTGDLTWVDTIEVTVGEGGSATVSQVLSEEALGAWRIEILDGEGEFLAELVFDVVPVARLASSRANLQAASAAREVLAFLASQEVLERDQAAMLNIGSALVGAQEVDGVVATVQSEPDGITEEPADDGEQYEQAARVDSFGEMLFDDEPFIDDGDDFESFDDGDEPAGTSLAETDEIPVPEVVEPEVVEPEESVAAVPAQDAEEVEAEGDGPVLSADTFSLRGVEVCRELDGRNPVSTEGPFILDGERLYIWMSFRNSTDQEHTVQVNWQNLDTGNEVIRETRVRPSRNHRTWVGYDMRRSRDLGRWRVEIIGPEEVLRRTVEFEVVTE